MRQPIAKRSLCNICVPTKWIYRLLKIYYPIQKALRNHPLQVEEGKTSFQGVIKSNNSANNEKSLFARMGFFDIIKLQWKASG